MRLAGAVACVLALGGCGEKGEPNDPPSLTILAASSLQKPLTDCAKDFEPARVRLSFAGSDQLAAQVRQGVRADVIALADAALIDRLVAEGLASQSITFASNRLVLAVGPGSPVRNVEDLQRRGVRIAMGSESVPAGRYAEQALRELEPGARRRVLANVRTREPDVKGVVGKLTQGAVDAGFVYASDVQGALKAIELPDRMIVAAHYSAAQVSTGNLAAGPYLAGLRSGACHEALLDAGFGSVSEW